MEIRLADKAQPIAGPIRPGFLAGRSMGFPAERRYHLSSISALESDIIPADSQAVSNLPAQFIVLQTSVRICRRMKSPQTNFAWRDEVS